MAHLSISAYQKIIIDFVMSVKYTPRPAAFIDRDGVINEERNYVHRIDDFVFLPGAIEGLRKFQNLGFVLVVVTNQAGIARGLYSEAAFQRLTHHMQNELLLAGVRIAGVYYCPHHPHGCVENMAIDCDCRKPRPGMLLAAANDLGLNLEGSVLVGDKKSDIEAGQLAGVSINILVESGHVLDDDSRNLASFVCSDLAAAADLMEILLSSMPLSS